MIFLEECQNPVRFEGSVDSSLLPLFTLPAPQGVTGPEANILWHEAKIKLIPSVGARCNITAIYYLKNDRLWQEAAPNLFYTDWSNGDARLYVSVFFNFKIIINNNLVKFRERENHFYCVYILSHMFDHLF